MTLINVSASIPTLMWPVVRFLASVRKGIDKERARAYLSPPALGDDGKVFDAAVSTLVELGLVEETEGVLSLAASAKELDADNLADFQKVLREAVLAPERNTGLGDDDSHTGPRDLTRALAWYLSLDPSTTALNWAEAQQVQEETSFRPEIGRPLVNNTRWNRFAYWASALGLATPSLLTNDRLVPDCTTAVRQVVQSRWKPGEQLPALQFLHALRAALPVLPGGAYAEAIGLPSPGDAVAGPSLSFALLRGEDEGWLRLDRDADAPQYLSVHSFEQGTSPRSCTSITILEDPRG
ncbi:hypothetical protein NI17_008010 [Thermobifida halotolerans]|uniref:Uncharacterized protein n=1 Tax=Thermobifida halotolerans TaxID=483545 RepID=A0AA97LZM6_9ACTN|nr:protein DpdG [Thermobifida halotolerans]UOE21080.1 hypothetical protein NI17_008010 [Thermobifida halotolerans]